MPETAEVMLTLTTISLLLSIGTDIVFILQIEDPIVRTRGPHWLDTNKPKPEKQSQDGD
jgi:hypothetical protein